MITTNGKPSDGNSGVSRGSKGLSEEQLAEVLKKSNAELLETIGGMVQGGGTRVVEVVREGDGQRVDLDDKDSLKDLAKIMSNSSEVEGTNFESLGKEKKVEGGEGQDKTIDLLKNIP
jgi:hypothetical protein